MLTDEERRTIRLAVDFGQKDSIVRDCGLIAEKLSARIADLEAELAAAHQATDRAEKSRDSFKAAVKELRNALEGAKVRLELEMAAVEQLANEGTLSEAAVCARFEDIARGLAKPDSKGVAMHLLVSVNRAEVTLILRDGEEVGRGASLAEAVAKLKGAAQEGRG